MKKFALIALTACLALPAPAALAQVDGMSSSPRERQKAIADQQKRTQAEAERLKQEAEATQNDLETLQQRLVRASAKERELAERLATLMARTRQLEAEQQTMNTALMQQRQHLAELLVGLARLSRMPPEVGLLREGNTRDAINTALLLESALPQVKGEAHELAVSLQKLDEVEKELAAERKSLAEARVAQDQEQNQIEILIRARQKKLQLTNKEQNEMTARLDKLRAEAANVEDLIRKISTPRPSKADKPPTVLALRGGFLQPVSGPVTRQFGQADEVGSKSMGLSFTPDSATRIVAPASGRVMFAGPFKGYGDIVIIEHEADMHSLVAGFGRLDVTVGQKVSQGEPLGVAKNGTDVYFELRHDGEPIDPRLRQH